MGSADQAYRDMTMNINVKGVWWGCKHAILAMRNNPTNESLGLRTGGSIINVASFVAIMGAATPQLACMYDIFSSFLYSHCYRYCIKG
jgi:NAD(P)-dependent dehydrogenase (short-subunit alcohol dehydrogenase family)